MEAGSWGAGVFFAERRHEVTPHAIASSGSGGGSCAGGSRSSSGRRQPGGARQPVGRAWVRVLGHPNDGTGDWLRGVSRCGGRWRVAACGTCWAPPCHCCCRRSRRLRYSRCSGGGGPVVVCCGGGPARRQAPCTARGVGLRPLTRHPRQRVCVRASNNSCSDLSRRRRSGFGRICWHGRVGGGRGVLAAGLRGRGYGRSSSDP